MISRVRPSFWRLFAELSDEQKRAARLAYLKFAENPGHPSLHFKKLAGFERYWSVRINEQYRAVGRRDGDQISWFWIGSHNDFDKFFR